MRKWLSGKTRNFRLTPATVIAGLALFVVLGGTSIAASGLLDGKKIKPGTITAKQIRNRTITAAKLDPKAVSSLRGARGPAGATGPTGPASLPAASEDESHNVSFTINAGALDLAELALPAGRYMVTAKADLRPNATADTSCWVSADYGDYLDFSSWSATAPGQTNTLALTGISPPGTETLTLRCSLGDVAGTTGRNKLVAVPVAG